MKNLPELFNLSAVGLNLVFSTFIGLGLGLLADKYLNTKPYFTIIFLLLGIVSGFIHIFRVAKFK